VVLDRGRILCPQYFDDAFEDIGDTLLGIHHELVELRHQGKNLSARLTMKRES
jgi:hypothetical protein